MPTSRPAHIYPFTAIVGQETLKTAILLNAVDHRVGGVLIRGEKGTAKSTAVRALAAVLPEIDVVDGCRFGCDPAEPGSWCSECRERRDQGPLPKTRRRCSIVDLPVSATEDRLVGTLDLGHALKHGEKVYEPGLLAQANRAILYVDEVNLLDDHLIDTLLDAAAMGVNTVEREGVSFSHPASFILIGTMNPEEGEVRPQLLDRFGLCVEVRGERDPNARVQIMKRRRAFDDDAVAFARQWVDAEDELQVRLKHARLRLPSLEVSDSILEAVARLCAAMGVDGHRADLTLVRAAAALAALEGDGAVAETHIRRVAPLVFVHRVRRTPFHDEVYDEQRLQQSVAQALAAEDSPGPSAAQDEGSASSEGQNALNILLAGTEAAEDRDPQTVDPELARPVDRARRSIGGRRQDSVSADSRGRYSRAEPARAAATVDVALDATIRAAASLQIEREGDMAINVRPEDIHTKVRTRKVGASIVFCVDASGSMGAADRMSAAKSAILELLVDAYQRRDRVGLVSFRGNEAEVVLAPTASGELANLKLRSLPTGGATPLAAGLLRSLELLEVERRRSSDVVPWIVLVTDGRANVGLDGGLGSEDARAIAARVRSSGINMVVIDTGTGPRTVSGARDIARAADAEYVRLSEFDGHAVADTVRATVSGG